MNKRARPSDVILDLMRGRSAKGLSAGYLIEACSLFGFKDNTVRVTLSRLQARGLIDSPERGIYRLAATADPVNEFVERWRDGERRVREWRAGDWIVVHLPGVDGHAFWALDALGFREVRETLFARPDNLDLLRDQLQQMARRIGLPADALFVYGEVSEDAQRWRQVWNCSAVEAGYAEMQQRLQISAQRLSNLSRDDARLESFRLGGEAINLLAKDPLLPGQWVDINLRRSLWQQTIDYERQGKRIWAYSRSTSSDVFPVARAAHTSARPPKEVQHEA